MELSYEVSMLGLGRICANPLQYPNWWAEWYYAQSVTTLERSSHPSPSNTSARSGAESEPLSTAVSLICQSDGAHACTCVEPCAP